MKKVTNGEGVIKEAKKVMPVDPISVSVGWRDSEIVTVERELHGKPLDGFQGIVVSESEDLLYMRVIDQLIIPNGFSIVCKNTIIDRILEERSDFIKEALELKNFVPDKPPFLDIFSIKSTINSLMNNSILTTVYVEGINSEVVYIGNIKLVGEIYFNISPISLSGIEYNDDIRFKILDCTRVDFGGEYESALQLVYNNKIDKNFD